MSERNGRERTGIEDHTLPHHRPVGSYLIELYDGHIEEAEPTGFFATKYNTRHKEAVVKARSLTRENRGVKLTGPIEVHDSPALD